MLIRYLLITMLALSTLQSVVSVADVHQNHQLGTEHLEFDHDEYEQAGVDADTALKMSDIDIDTCCLDCNQSCHCHSAHVPGMVPVVLFAVIQFNLSPIYNSRLLKRQYAFLRPPQT